MPKTDMRCSQSSCQPGSDFRRYTLSAEGPFITVSTQPRSSVVVGRTSRSLLCVILGAFLTIRGILDA